MKKSAKKSAKAGVTVTNVMRLLNLPIKIQNAVADGTITEGHARAILALQGLEKQLAMLEMIFKDEMTVRQVEDKVRGYLTAEISARAPRDFGSEVAALESELRGKLGTKVKVQRSGQSGKITIGIFFSRRAEWILDKVNKLEQ